MKKLCGLFLIMTINILPQFLQDEVEVTDNRTKSDRIVQLFDELSNSFKYGNTNLLSGIIKASENQKSDKEFSDNREEISNLHLLANSKFKYLKYDIINTDAVNDSMIKVNALITLYNDIDKISFHWKFDIITNRISTCFLENQFLDAITSATKNNKQEIDALTDLNRINNISLIPYPHTIDPEYYEINKNLTVEELDRQLYGDNTEIDMVKLHYGVDEEEAAVFTTDNYWERIVYSKKNSGEIKAFSHSQMSDGILNVTGITTQMNGTSNNYLYTVSGFPINKIHKFQYFPSSNHIAVTNTYNITGTHNFTDISNRQSGSLLYVADKMNGIKVYNYQGTELATLTEFSFNGQTYWIDNITRLEISNASHAMGFIDKNGKRLVVGRYYPNSYGFTALNVIEMPEPGLLSDVGINLDNEIIFADRNQHRLYKFNYWGEYICTYQNEQWFYQPARLSNIAYDRPDIPAIEFYVSNQWSPTRGIRRYLLGSDALDLSFEQIGYSYLHLNYFLTGDSYIILDVLQNGVVRYSRTYTWKASGSNTEVLNYTDLGYGNYTFRITYRHWQDDKYNDYSQGFRIKTVNFQVSNYPPPSISGFVQNPNPICKGSSGNVQVNAQGYGTLYYNWISIDQPSYISINPNGNVCGITYHNSKATEDTKGRVWQLGCTVSNSGGSNTQYYEPNLIVDCSGCPTLAFDENGILTDENPLLITSLSNPGVDITDYYLINTPITPQNNRINLTIHEPQTEHTWLDKVELFETRVRDDEQIAVSNDGQVINYRGIIPASIILNGETEITEQLSSIDSMSVLLKPGDVITVSLNTENIEDEGDAVIAGEEGPIVTKRIPAMTMKINNDKNSEIKQEGISEKEIPLEFFLRPNKSIVSRRIPNLNKGNIEITINKELTIDYFVFVTNLRTARTRTLALQNAKHNVSGDMLTALNTTDQNYAEIFPTERIDLSFQAGIIPGRKAYILKTTGRYETDTTSIGRISSLAKQNEIVIPTENMLFDNYPNPFNPTTIIKYALKDDATVTLKIFNTLGQEIKTLVNEMKPSGYYQVEFDASDLASGIYIYRIQAGEFISTKKMLMLK